MITYLIIGLVIIILIAVYNKGRSFVAPSPNTIKYIEYYKGFIEYLAKNPSKPVFLFETNDYLHYYKWCNVVEMSCEDIRISLYEPVFFTKDNAKVQLDLVLSVRLKYEDIASGNKLGKGKPAKTIDELAKNAPKGKNPYLKSVQIFQTKGEKADSTPVGIAQVNLRDRLKKLVDELQKKIYFVELELPHLTGGRTSSLASNSNKSTDHIDLIEKYVFDNLAKKSLSKPILEHIEERADEILNEYNFEVIKGFSSLSITYDSELKKEVKSVAEMAHKNTDELVEADFEDKHMDDVDYGNNNDEPDGGNKPPEFSKWLSKGDFHHTAPIVEFIQLYDKVKEDLKKKKVAHKKALYEEEKKELDLEQKKITDIEDRLSKTEIDKARITATGEVDKATISADKSIAESEQIQRKIEADANIEETKWEIEQKKMEVSEKIMERRSKLMAIEDYNKIPLLWEEVDELLQKNVERERQKLIDETLEIRFKDEIRRKVVDFTETQWNHQLGRELKLDDLRHQLIEKLLSRELLLAYSDLDFNQRNNLIKNLGTSINQALSSAKGVAGDIKIINTSSGKGGSSIMDFLSKITDGVLQSEAFKPLIDNALEEVGLGLSKVSQNGSSDSESKSSEGGIKDSSSEQPLNKAAEVRKASSGEEEEKHDNDDHISSDHFSKPE